MREIMVAMIMLIMMVVIEIKIKTTMIRIRKSMMVIVIGNYNKYDGLDSFKDDYDSKKH